MIAALAVIAGAGTATGAPFTSYDLERLQLDPSAMGSLVLGTGEVLPAEGLRLSLAAHWERSPLVLEKDGDLRGRGLFWERSKAGEIVRNRFTGHLGIALALTSRVELGIRVPYIVGQRGDDLSAAGYPQLRKDDTGMPSAMLRANIHSQSRGAPVSVAVAVGAAMPFRHAGDVDGNPGDVITPQVEVGRSFGSFLLAANVGANFRTDEVDLTNGEELRHELLAGIVAATTGRPLRLEASLRGQFNFDGVSQNVELLGGARYALARWAEAFAIAGPGFMESPGTPTFRALVGLAIGTWEPKAAPAAAPVAAAAPVDPCAKGQPHTPEQCPDNDDDGDGVKNKDDRCPTEKGPAANHGCPAIDSDGDGIPDYLDKCPKEKGLKKYDGCPAPDRDGDGVPDDEDKCPDQPGVPENQGCPPKRAEIKTDAATGQKKIDIKEKVYFDSGKATIQSRSFPLLDDVAKLIVANPKAGKVQVQGHTDNTGPAEYNRKLSQDRADAVKKYLTDKGVQAARLDTKGFGPDKPAQPNTTAKGREANRRVEFIIE